MLVAELPEPLLVLSPLVDWLSIAASGRHVTIFLVSSLLRDLATHRVAGDPVTIRYDATRQSSEVLEDGRWIPSWESAQLQQTKKCDHETGEDQKGM